MSTSLSVLGYDRRDNIARGLVLGAARPAPIEGPRGPCLQLPENLPCGEVRLDPVAGEAVHGLAPDVNLQPVRQLEQAGRRQRRGGLAILWRGGRAPLELLCCGDGRWWLWFLLGFRAGCWGFRASRSRG